MYGWMDACMHVYVCMRVCLYVCLYACMYVCVYMYVCIVYPKGAFALR